MWEYLSKPENSKAKVRCAKCRKVDFRKVNEFRILPRTYCWCPSCGNDLVRDSFVNEDKDGIVTYKCSECEVNSKWDFASAPIPILLDSSIKL